MSNMVNQSYIINRMNSIVGEMAGVASDETDAATITFMKRNYGPKIYSLSDLRIDVDVNEKKSPKEQSMKCGLSDLLLHLHSFDSLLVHHFP